MLSGDHDTEDQGRMQTDLSNLPRNKQRDLERVVDCVSAEMIILLGLPFLLASAAAILFINTRNIDRY